MTHQIVAVQAVHSAGCAQCGPTTPHNVVVLCECGQRACGITDHIWTVTRREDGRIWLSPSFNWLIDPKDPSAGSHVHEFVQGVVESDEGTWPTRDVGAER